MNYTKKLHTIFIIQVSLIVFAAGIELLTLHFFRNHTITIDQNINESIAKIDKLVNSSKVSLTQPTLSKYNTYRNYINDSHQQLMSLIAPPRNETGYISPLEFKEELLRIQKLLMERADLWEIKVPLSFSFDKYEGGNIPREKEVQDLTIQLRIVRGIVNYLIESHIAELKEIKRIAPQSIKIAGEKELYEIFAFQLQFSGSMENVLTFLSKIFMSRELFIIRRIDLYAKSNDLLSITIDIDYIKFRG